jgi:hypothetical protein
MIKQIVSDETRKGNIRVLNNFSKSLSEADDNLHTAVRNAVIEQKGFIKFFEPCDEVEDGIIVSAHMYADTVVRFAFAPAEYSVNYKIWNELILSEKMHVANKLEQYFKNHNR